MPKEDDDMKLITINKERIKYLLSLFKMTAEELLRDAGKGLKKPLLWEDVYRDSIPLNTLKRVDSVFHKGLIYYVDPETPKMNKEVSVFFRKESFEANLSFGARLRVREFEDLKTRLNTISKLSDVRLRRTLPSCTLKDNPCEVAYSIRDLVLPVFTAEKRTFLRNFINKLGEMNVMVFEFVDIKQKKYKANVDGFYLSPNAIVLKRRQESFSREIFTLAHELGHYLLNKEEIEEVDVTALTNLKISDVERWCNMFSYHLLIGKEQAGKLDAVRTFDASNDYGHDLVKEISQETNVSRLAIFTNLLVQKKLSYESYVDIKEELENQWREKEVRIARKRELERESGSVSQGRNPQPIRAEIVKDIYTVALSSGVIGEQEYCKALKIKPESINAF
ncbi:MAG TPA: hypothetical protein DD383_01385, partial [Rikenellaceae bacterium]|nr:hypothetical protein [Rikenellaceae bacterium]